MNHPVWGHGLRSTWHWVAQVPRPFMLPAADQDSDAALEQFAKVITDWARKDGFT